VTPIATTARSPVALWTSTSASRALGGWAKPTKVKAPRSAMVCRKVAMSSAGEVTMVRNSAEKWARTSASVRVAASPPSLANTQRSCRLTGVAGRMALAQVLIR